MLFNLQDPICIIQLCFLWKEIIFIAINGSLTGAFGLRIVLFQKYLERREYKYHNSLILNKEIKRIIMAADQVNIFININRERKPGTKIYDGLLSTGNIKYFSSNLQDELDALYRNVSESYLNINKGNAIKISKELLKIMKANNGFWKGFGQFLIFYDLYAFKGLKIEQ